MNIKVPWLPFGIRAITLWPLILLTPAVAADPCVLLHERYHWKQALRWGVLPWYVAYLALLPFYWRRPANEHPLEREAYRLQWVCKLSRLSPWNQIAQNARSSNIILPLLLRTGGTIRIPDYTRYSETSKEEQK